METKEPTRRELENISLIVRQYMLSNGGIANGYATTAVGVVDYSDSKLALTFPNTDELTIGQLKEKGTELYNKIRAYMRKRDLSDNCEIWVKSKHVEHGCYSIYVEYVMRVDVALWGE